MIGDRGNFGRKVPFWPYFGPRSGVPLAGKPDDGFIGLKMGCFGPFWAQNDRKISGNPPIESGTPDSTRTSRKKADSIREYFESNPDSIQPLC